MMNDQHDEYSEMDIKLRKMVEERSKAGWFQPVMIVIMVILACVSLFAIPSGSYAHWFIWGGIVIGAWFMMGPAEMEHFRGG